MYHLPRAVIAPLFVLAAMLSACSYFTSGSKHLKSTLPQTAEYVQHLSLIALNTEPGAEDLEILQAYTAKQFTKARRHSLANVRIPAVIFECKPRSGAAMQQLASPFDNAGHEAVLEMVNRMTDAGCVLYNLHPAMVTVRRGEPLNFKKDTPDQIHQKVQERLDVVLHGAERLAPLDDAKTDITLARIFMDNQERDSAYLAVDNAKHALALAENTPDAKAATDDLLKQLEDVENQLHRTMPFSL